MPILVAVFDALDNLYRFPLIILPVAGGLVSLFLFYMLIRLMRETNFIGMQINDWIRAREGSSPKTEGTGPVAGGQFAARWQEVQGHAASDNEANWRTAIIGADAILDEIFQESGYKGETMGERMKNIQPHQFPHLDDAWRAHKVRNFLAHDASYKLSREATDRTMAIYERIFTELGVL